ncbi:hypothetical protein AUEXF2481DRAFT_77717 [Aureobasidium subglaciale EXF-2481]|uniref:Serine aminopeptidase S33 domain-containing protein n=1 Tax=Aureobasidium subglaciale (strain EXF-2481) TaxID=1043005 RepID=A0A074YNU2_AURSE|nr:uncharacterized protein AUEXF2481DRAFT_77717 [Aureobasidium subglaciale EXF-2481]KEQ97794.1 hypothetical protein AUEXF2481DRAFT_77717 [Aureobasidium subglaciale EXF-2481]
MELDPRRYMTGESAIPSLGFSLYTKSWKPTGTVKARLVFIHGFSDHCNGPDFFFSYLASHGIEVHSFDQRGFGRSVQTPKQRGKSGPTKTVLLDMTEMIMTVLPSPYPVFLMGHSMGGQQVLYYSTQGPASILQQISGFITEAPAIISPMLLARHNAEVEADEMFHGYCTLEGMNKALDRAEYNTSAGRKQLGDATPRHEPSLLMLHGTSDDVCLPSSSEVYFGKCPLTDKELKLYNGWLHEMHTEIGEDKLTFAQDVTQWILSRSK